MEHRLHFNCIIKRITIYFIIEYINCHWLILVNIFSNILYFGEVPKIPKDPILIMTADSVRSLEGSERKVKLVQAHLKNHVYVVAKTISNTRGESKYFG